MTKEAHLVHGYNVSDGGENTTDRLTPWLIRAGWTVKEHDYGWFGLLRVRFFNGMIAERIKNETVEPCIGIGHSNGCAILAEAADRGAKFHGLVFINPALESDRIVAPHVKWIHVYHNRDDLPVRVSKLLDLLPWNWKKRHPWGDMGNKGFTGEDARYVNIDCGKYGVSGHSDLFRKMAVMGPVILSVSLSRPV